MNNAQAAAAHALAAGRRIDRWIPPVLLDSPISRLGYLYGCTVGWVWGTLWSTGRVQHRGGLWVFRGMPRWTFPRGGVLQALRIKPPVEKCRLFLQCCARLRAVRQMRPLLQTAEFPSRHDHRPLSSASFRSPSISTMPSRSTLCLCCDNGRFSIEGNPAGLFSPADRRKSMYVWRV